jgi:uncharacterized protein YjiS (DUF1127 family)
MPQTLTFGRTAASSARDKSHRGQTAGPSLWQLFTGLFQRGNERLHTIRELHALSDEMLRDIGVERDDIERSVDAMLAASSEDTSRSPR